MRPPPAHRLRLGSLSAHRPRASETTTGRRSAPWARAASSDAGANPFRRAPTALEGEALPEVRSVPPAPKPWPKPKPVLKPASPPKPRVLVKSATPPDPRLLSRRAPTPFEGEVLPEARTVPPRSRYRSRAKPASPPAEAGQAGEPAETVTKQDDLLAFRRRAPTPFEGESLINPAEVVTRRRKRQPRAEPEPATAVPLSPEAAKQLFLRAPDLFEDEDTPIEVPAYLSAEPDWVEDDTSLADAEGDPVVLTKRSRRRDPLISIITAVPGRMPPSPIGVAIGDSLRCIASFEKVPTLQEETIYVPGAPRVFKQQRVPFWLSPEPEPEGQVPAFQMESAFMAIRAMSPDFRFDGVDVVMTLSTILSLQESCIDGKLVLPQSVKTTFFTMIRNTLVLFTAVDDTLDRDNNIASRRKLWEQIGGMFQDNFTEPLEGTGRMGRYQRVLNYKLGDMNCVVISEPDAALPLDLQPDDGDRPSLDDTVLSPATRPEIQPVPSAPRTGDGVRCGLLPGGEYDFFERRHFVEMKTADPSHGHTMAQLYLSDSRYHAQAYVRNDAVWEWRVHDMREELTAWEQEHQPVLRRTVTLLHYLRSVARSRGEGLTSVYWKIDEEPETEKPALLKLKKWYHNIPPLPQELVDHFWTKPEEETEQQAVEGQDTRSLDHRRPCAQAISNTSPRDPDQDASQVTCEVREAAI